MQFSAAAIISCKYAPIPFAMSVSLNKPRFLFCGATPHSGPGPPHYRGFTITLRHTTLGKTPLDKWSAWRRDLYLTTHNTHKRQTSIISARFEPAIPASERPQTPRLRPRSHWDRHKSRIHKLIIIILFRERRIFIKFVDTFQFRFISDKEKEKFKLYQE
jgi:hypothetical protein